ncbi:acyl-CoA Delta-9 desaturase isoform X1 [Halyomorpha halys]|uniref:acyl-CoA Delta-9 desaturase isoform X1 n=1 Tax=Halyomorpha halys TaxID=286706 RepID=UPI0006D4E616|nr:acyl-CoA Delta(11) desaturase isoform X1 [Halyomorpha halys]XP_014270305.1 acyl-CoA Delta(11) desaturase isoform X1 [Halyomorpha halys]XP_014270306.1 acyl-CoA Delta(11) desaturase isoform X1 [Halyomorpha halys]
MENTYAAEDTDKFEETKIKNEPFLSRILWIPATILTTLHLGGMYGWYLVFTGRLLFLTFVFDALLGHLCGLSITIGAHRLFSHRSFKAKKPLRLCLLLLHTISAQNSLWAWVRDHRQHHKYSDTDADPHNSNRGFFFSHIGWTMLKKQPEVQKYARKIDMSDLQADPWIMFQKRYYVILYFIFPFLIPTAIPYYFWNETLWNSFFMCLARNVAETNLTCMVNSFAHIYGTKPYNKNMKAAENKYVSIFTKGEGWHNYHHMFPWDCNAAELGRDYNHSGNILAFLERIGQAYDLKKATKEMTMNSVRKYGDGTHPFY